MTSANAQGVQVSPIANHTLGVRSISEALDGHRNSLGLIRLVLALLVIVDHSFPLSGTGADPIWGLTRGQASFGSIAVMGFFAISGYLIAKSGMSSDVVQFMWRRVLRIFPAYWLVLVLTAFLVAPAVWVAEGNNFADFYSFSPTGPIGYIVKNWTLTIGTYGIYDIFADTTPYGREVGASVFNGSLWTLSYEFGCYVLIGIFVIFGVLSRARIIVPITTISLAALQLVAFTGTDVLVDFVPRLADPQLIPLALAFLLGSTIAMYSKQIPFDDRLGLLSFFVLLVTLRTGGFAVVGVAAGAYFVMYLAARLPKKLQWIGAKNDYSYGIYIYGFLVQQVTAYLGWHKLGLVLYILIAMVLSAGMAWISWHLVEKRAMQLKSWGPGRGIRYWYDSALTHLPARTRKD